MDALARYQAGNAFYGSPPKLTDLIARSRVRNRLTQQHVAIQAGPVSRQAHTVPMPRVAAFFVIPLVTCPVFDPKKSNRYRARKG